MATLDDIDAAIAEHGNARNEELRKCAEDLCPEEAEKGNR